MELERKKEVINICLEHFVERGLSEASTRSLSNALKLQNGGLYYYFSSKDEAIILCAEEAALRLENILIFPALDDFEDLDLMMKRLRSRADEMAPMMRFFVSVCASKRYKDGVKPVLERLAKRYDQYADIVAESLHCKKEDIEPYVYMTITAVSNYMIFAEDSYVVPQMKIVKEAIKNLANTVSKREMGGNE